MATWHDLDLVEPSPFKSLLNFRDVGRTVNRLQGKAQVYLLRATGERIHTGGSSLFQNPTRGQAVPQRKVDQYHVRNIIDLRSKTEHIQKSKKHSPSPSPASSIEIPTISYHNISLNGPAFERALLKQLKYTSLFKLLSLMALGYRIEAISILGAEVMQPRGLTGLAFDTLASSTAELRSIFRLLADDRRYPIMIHCTQGKDRTGLVVLLLLLLLKVPVGAIVADYRSSERELQVEMEERIGELRTAGLREDFAQCPVGFAEAVIAEIDQKYGGIESYMANQVGINDGMQLRIQKSMLV